MTPTLKLAISSGNFEESASLGPTTLKIYRDLILIEEGVSNKTNFENSLKTAKELCELSVSHGDYDTAAECYALLLEINNASNFSFPKEETPYSTAQLVAEVETVLPRVSEPQRALLLAWIAALLQDAGRAEAPFPKLEEAMRLARHCANRTALITCLNWYIYFLRDKLSLEHDPEEATKTFEQAKAMFDELSTLTANASDIYSEFTRGIALGNLIVIEAEFAKVFVANPDQKKKILREAIEDYRLGFEDTRSIGGHPAVFILIGGLNAYVALVLLVESSSERTKLLNEAYELSRLELEMTLYVEPYFSWNIGVSHCRQGRVEYLIARETQRAEEKQEWLRRAGESYRKGLQKMQEERVLSKALHARLGNARTEAAAVFEDTFLITRDEKSLSEALSQLAEASDNYFLADKLSLAAEAHWKRGQLLGSTKAHRSASAEYQRASETYEKCALRAQSSVFSEVYRNLSVYMKAWSLIEESRDAHTQGYLLEASKKYDDAATLFSESTVWKTLSSYCSAQASLEEGEALSLEEKFSQACDAFRRSTQAFSFCVANLQNWIPPTWAMKEEERRLWQKVASKGEQYSLARLELEEARILDEKGEKLLSARKFASAAKMLENLSLLEETDEGRRGILYLMLNCKAWQSMKEAEAYSDSKKYLLAADTFEESADSAVSDKETMLAKGHACFCRALAAGTQLRLTREEKYYVDTKRYLETAADCYMQAGMSRASEWTRGTERMFDGIVYLRRAEAQIDPASKSRLYALAKRSFEAARDLFHAAGYTGKEAEAHKYLRRTIEELQVFAYPEEVLDPKVTLKTKPGSTLSYGRFMGARQFEQATMLCRLDTNEKMVLLGKRVRIKIEIANVGRADASLLRLEDFPLDIEITAGDAGFEYSKGRLDLKRHRLQPGRILEFELQFVFRSPGATTLRPLLVFSDSFGRMHINFAAPLTLNVVDHVKEEGVPVQSVNKEESKGEERKLAAIMFTDMVGYTALAHRDEELSLELLEEHRRMIRALIRKYSGTEIKTIGDSFLIEFTSTLDAVKCALNIQSEIRERNGWVDPKKQFQIRVGIHVGDVVHKEGDVYGDAVNIAARVEPMAEPGTICLTSQVYEQVKNRISAKIGEGVERTVKNISTPITVYEVSPL